MSGTATAADVAIDHLHVAACTVPTDWPEADGTIAWDKTTLVLVEAGAGGRTGIGYTYADRAAAHLVDELLAGVVRGRDAFAVPASWACRRCTG
jgi:hypothetical protein